MANYEYGKSRKDLNPLARRAELPTPKKPTVKVPRQALPQRVEPTPTVANIEPEPLAVPEMPTRKKGRGGKLLDSAGTRIRPVRLPDPSEWRPWAVCTDPENADRFKSRNPEDIAWALGACAVCDFKEKCIAQTVVELRTPRENDVLEYVVRAGWTVERIQESFNPQMKS